MDLTAADLASKERLKAIRCGECGVEFDAGTLVMTPVAAVASTNEDTLPPLIPPGSTVAPQAEPPRVKKTPTAANPVLNAAAEAQVRKTPTGPQQQPKIRKEPTGPQQIKKEPTGKHEKVGDKPKANGKEERVKGETAETTKRTSRRMPSKIGEYEILEEINRGGMGIVYKARDPQLRRQVAIKVLLAGEGATDEDIKRFQREAQSTARLQHSNIVPIYAVGTHEGKPYFVMDFIEGKTAKQLKEEGRISPRLALGIIEGVAEALHHAHLNGVVHRDVKPGNILVDKFERAQLMDFGLARRVDEDLDITQAGTTMGTPSYMAPEQAEGKLDQVDAQSDLYSAGACLYELLTGQPPFDGPTIMAVLRKVVDDQPIPPRQINPKIHRDVETICMKCLEKEKAQRYANCKELADDIRRFNMGEAIAAKPLGLIPALIRKARRHREITIASTVVVLAIFAAIGYTVKQSRDAAQEQIRERNEKIETAVGAGRKLLKGAKSTLAELDESTRAGFEAQSDKAQEAIEKALDAYREAEYLAPENAEVKEALESLRKMQTDLEVRGFVHRARVFLDPLPAGPEGKTDLPNFSGAEFAAREALKRQKDNADARALLNTALGIRAVNIEAAGAPADVYARRILDRAGRQLPGDPEDKGTLLGKTPIKGKELEPGLYVVTLQRKDAGAQQYTLWVSRDARDDDLQIRAAMNTAEENMALIPEGNVILPQLGAQKIGAFLIDRYEFPNRAGQMPESGFTAVEIMSKARRKCGDAGKKVCTSSQWLRACMGDGDRRYPYGKSYVPNTCATGYASESQRRPFVSGYFSRCQTPEGVYDMSGNVAEWTETEQTETIYGGEWTSLTGVPDLTVSCRARLLTSEGNPDRLGFRCCKPK
ncbi:MAG TPA: protein kinase [Planctomycetota bacterium]|nr:protein kinase [Planctomycetota bacterium]